MDIEKAKGKAKVGGPDYDGNSSVSVEESLDTSDKLKGSTYVNNFNSDLVDLEEGDEDYIDDDDDDDDDVYLYEDDDESDYLAIQSQFDNVDLPSGVEASISWLKEPAGSSGVNTPGSSSSTVVDPNDCKRKSSILDNVAETKRVAVGNDGPAVATSGSSSGATSSSNGEVFQTEDNEENAILCKFKSFKQFDTVEDCSDHHYLNYSDEQCSNPQAWMKTIQEEWKILEKGLPDTISVRVYESKMELLRAVIVGPAGTPYHDGLFVFDCFFPSTYPNTPPMVYYYSGGLRLNPNLYECGKVCLSLLGTWTGDKNEKWIPGTSTMLQVLVSIQALILNANPFFNEPGYDLSYRGEEGDRRSRQYSENAFILSTKTMMYTVRKPPKHFEDYVIGHFHSRAYDILAACKAYIDGAMVGTVAVKDGVAEINKEQRKGSAKFIADVKKMTTLLVRHLTTHAYIDCEKFRISN